MSVYPGTGGFCVYCHKRIDAESVECEVDAYVAAGLRTLHFHRICLHLWEELLSQDATTFDAKGMGATGRLPYAD